MNRVRGREVKGEGGFFGGGGEEGLGGEFAEHGAEAVDGREGKLPKSPIPTHLIAASLERAMGFEPTTSSLGSWHSTTELRPRDDVAF